MNEIKHDNFREDRRVGMVGNSLYVTIPKEIAAQLGIKKGDTLSVGQENGRGFFVPKHVDEEEFRRFTMIEQLFNENKHTMDYLADK
jgi:putative addiction module antidote